MLQNGNLKLRATTRDDMQRQWKFENNPEIWYWDGGAPKPTKLETVLGYYDEDVKDHGNDSVSFAIEIDAQYVGKCSLDVDSSVNRTCELAIEIGDSSFRGQGYGQKAVNLLLAYAFVHWNINRVWLKTHSLNERAIGCYLACGFVEEGRLRQHIWLKGEYVDRVMMGVLRSDVDLEMLGGLL